MTKLTPAAIAKIGVRLYGPAWKQPMADALETTVSTVRRWANGTVEVPGPARVALRLMVRDIAGRTFGESE